MVLGYSRHMFAKLVFDQKAITWLALLNEPFGWFGGVPITLHIVRVTDFLVGKG